MLNKILKYLKSRVQWKFRILRKYWWTIIILFVALQIWLRHIVLLRNTLGPIGQ
jgi:hypothetical protein